MSDDTHRFPTRSRPAHPLPLVLRNRSSIVFLTVCTQGKQPLLANPEMHARLRDAWRKADRWLVGRYVVMPDHIHLFCAPGTIPATPLSPWVAYWKRLVAFQSDRNFWQKNFWDTQLRNGDSYASKWEYVRNNPVRAGLVGEAADWAFQGELNILRWRE